MLSESILEEFQSFALDLAMQSGTILKKYWGRLIEVKEKGHKGDLVTNADKESENLLVQRIGEYYPAHSILAEESGLHKIEGAEFEWVLDPLDGTTNYTHTFPFVAVSIALLYQEKPVLGVIYNPILEECYHASKAKGAYLNEKKIQVSVAHTLDKSLLATGFAYDRRDNPDTNYPEFCRMTHLSQGVRRAGSAALDLAFVARGSLDGYWERGIAPWDMAAGILIVEEAGGKVTDYDGEALDIFKGRVLATNGKIHAAMISELANI